MGDACLDGFTQRFFIHVSEHQNLAAGRFLRNARQQPVRAKTRRQGAAVFKLFVVHRDSVLRRTARSNILKVKIQNGDLQSIRGRIGVVGRNNADEIFAIVEFDRIRFFHAAHDFQFRIVE